MTMDFGFKTATDDTLPDGIEIDTDVIRAVRPHRKRTWRDNEILIGMGLAAIGAIGICIGWVAYGLSNRPVGNSDSIPATTVTIRPPAPAVRTKTRSVPGPTITRSLRATVRVRVTRTVPGPTKTVTATPTALSDAGDVQNP
jgi:hypothetical protein